MYFNKKTNYYVIANPETDIEICCFKYDEHVFKIKINTFGQKYMINEHGKAWYLDNMYNGNDCIKMLSGELKRYKNTRPAQQIAII